VEKINNQLTLKLIILIKKAFYNCSTFTNNEFLSDLNFLRQAIKIIADFLKSTLDPNKIVINDNECSHVRDRAINLYKILSVLFQLLNWTNNTVFRMHLMIKKLLLLLLCNAEIW